MTSEPEKYKRPASERRREKTPPSFYVCKACSKPGHWIYDCEMYMKGKRSKSDAEKQYDAKKRSERERQEEKDKTCPKKGGKKRGLESKAEPETDPCGAFITGLPFESTTASVMNLVKPFGAVKNVKLGRFQDKFKRCNGTAFVVFQKKDHAADCRQGLDGQEVEGRSLKVGTLRKLDRGAHKQAKKACYRCGLFGHKAEKCENARICYKCGSTDHLSFDCKEKKPKKKRKKDVGGKKE